MNLRVRPATSGSLVQVALVVCVALLGLLAGCSEAPEQLAVQTEADGEVRRVFLVDAKAQPVAGISCSAPGARVLDIYFQTQDMTQVAKLQLRAGDQRFDAMNVTARKFGAESSATGGVVLTPELEKTLIDAEKITISADDAARSGALDANSRQFIAGLLKFCNTPVR